MAEGTATTFTQSPASVSFSVLYSRAQNYILSPSDADVATIAKEGINEAIKRLNTRPWTWSRVATEVTFSGGEAGREYVLPGNFKSPRSFELIDLTPRVIGHLEYIDPKSFDILMPDRAQNVSPGRYTVFNVYDNGQLTLDAAPSTDWVAKFPRGRLRYNKKLAALVSDGDLFSGPSEAESFLVWHARAVLASHYAPDKIAYADRQASEWWRILVRDDVTVETRDFQ